MDKLKKDIIKSVVICTIATIGLTMIFSVTIFKWHEEEYQKFIKDCNQKSDTCLYDPTILFGFLYTPIIILFFYVFGKLINKPEKTWRSYGR